MTHWPCAFPDSSRPDDSIVFLPPSLTHFSVPVPCARLSAHSPVQVAVWSGKRYSSQTWHPGWLANSFQQAVPLGWPAQVGSFWNKEGDPVRTFWLRSGPDSFGEAVAFSVGGGPEEGAGIPDGGSGRRCQWPLKMSGLVRCPAKGAERSKRGLSLPNPCLERPQGLYASATIAMFHPTRA